MLLDLKIKNLSKDGKSVLLLNEKTWQVQEQTIKETERREVDKCLERLSAKALRKKP